MKICQAKGFTIIELVSVIVVVSILTASLSFRPVSVSLELQASRDVVRNIFKAAQNLAMSQNSKVAFQTQGSTISVLIDTNADGIVDSNANIIGETFPKTIDATLSSAQLTFNRLGYTQASIITVSNQSISVDISISASGYVY